MKNYTIYHLHSDYSNGTTNIDSVTKAEDYIDMAKKCKMKSLGFSEHGNIFRWYFKKKQIEEAGMKYIHGCEFYMTSGLDNENKIRDNYHIVLMAKNFEGMKELTGLVSKSYCRKENDVVEKGLEKDHFYYMPRISMEELFSTSNNIIVTTACLGNLLYKDDRKIQKIKKNLAKTHVSEDVEKLAEQEYDRLSKKMIEWLSVNKDRCFLEIQHHNCKEQIEYNKYLYDLSKKTGIRLIAGTDTHSLTEKDAKNRKLLQISKSVTFDGEDDFDLVFKTYNQLVEAYRQQNALEESVFLEAIENTNVMASMVESFSIDKSIKYPKLYDNPDETFRKHVYSKARKHPYLNARYKWEDLKKMLDTELDVYTKTKSADFMLLQETLRDNEKEMGIKCGPGRGSVGGSIVAYALGITDIDSKKFGLNFFRFMNPDRVTNADIDTDYSEEDKNKVEEFLLRDHMNTKNLKCTKIITFHTVQLKGGLKDIGRAYYNLYLKEKKCGTKEKDMEYFKYKKCTPSYMNKISKDANEDDEGKLIINEQFKKEFPEIIQGTKDILGVITAVGCHASALLVSDLDISELVGYVSLKTTPYFVSSLNMKEIDELMYVKLDILGLKNVGLLNDTCKLVGLEPITPDNVDLNDKDVWKSIKEDSTLIFQWESKSAEIYLSNLMRDSTIEQAKKYNKDFSMLKWLSFGNGLIRPAGASFRNDVADGKFYDNGLDILNDFLATTMGRLVMQEDIMKFLSKFCGYSDAESDNVRRAIAKKKGTETLLPEIKDRFVKYTGEYYNVKKEDAEKAIIPFLQVILDASAYAFSWNHSDAYSCIGYMCGYLRYYYPLEFITSALNIFSGNEKKLKAILQYANKQKIKLKNIKFGYSKAKYFFNKDENTIYKGIGAVKYLNDTIADDLYSMGSKMYKNFSSLLLDINKNTKINERQLDVLIQLDFFSDFGNAKELMKIKETLSFFKYCKVSSVSKSKIDEDSFLYPLIKEHSNGLNKGGSSSKSYKNIDFDTIVPLIEKSIKQEHLEEYSILEKIKVQNDYLGYISMCSGLEEDRRKLYVKSVAFAKQKGQKPFGLRIITKSIGSGKEGMFTVMLKGGYDASKRIRTKPPMSLYGEINEGDIIQCLKYKSRYGNNGIKYFTLLEYKILEKGEK